MFEQSEFRSDHDPAIAGTAVAPAPAKRHLRKTIRFWSVMAVVYGVMFGLAAGGFYLTRSAFRTGEWEKLLLAVVLLLPLASVVWHFLRNRIKTGPWAGDAEARKERLAKSKESRALDRNQPWSLWRYALTWAGYVAFEPTCSAWQRIAGWMILAGEAIMVLAIVAFGLIAIGASFADDNTLGQRAMFVGFGLLLFFLPGRAMRLLIRRRRAGQLRVSREELDTLRALRAAWRKRESEKPLSAKLLTIAAVVGALGLRWAMHSARHRHDGWVDAAIYAPLALYVLWVQFRKPKRPSENEPVSPTA